MQQRLFRRRDVEIAGLQQQRDIGRKRRAGGDVAAQLRIWRRQHPEPSQHQHRAQHDNQGRKDPPHAAVVEGDQAETLRAQFARDDAGDQEARDDEKDVDADEAARHRLGKTVEIHHQHDRDGAESVDIAAIAIRRQGQHRRVQVMRGETGLATPFSRSVARRHFRARGVRKCTLNQSGITVFDSFRITLSAP